ncbi:T9SS type A sorting domain-containing protein [Aquimarina algiphila]|uniref:T9SS type A sorting domain-containing protein n=1 Tax=Aquimarina algiphila TaxID=2047982 RepID=UPI0024926571|nr:T9SS type A sorting domain-containing protein [Aquimarina algiphila]
MKRKLCILTFLIACLTTHLAISQSTQQENNSKMQWNPRHPSWTDSYAANGFCWCDTTFDHNLDDINVASVTINGVKRNLRAVCDELKKHPQYRAYRNGDAPYNDIQCGNGPANDAPDEAGCPGRTDLGPNGCNQKGPRFDLNWLSSRPRFGGGGNPPNPPTGGSNVTFNGQSINKFISSEGGSRSMRANRNSAGAGEKFTVQSSGNGTVSIKGNNGKYVSSENGNKAMNCNRNAVGAWEKFTLESLGGDLYAIKGNNGKYVSHENGRDMGIFCNRNAIGSWEKFIIKGLNNKTNSLQIASDTKQSISLYPNPVIADNLSLQINVPADVHGSIEIISLNGKSIQKKDLGMLKKGSTSILLNELRNSINVRGLYLVNVKLGENSIVKQIMIE